MRPIQRVLDSITGGKPVVLIDRRRPQGEGYLVLSAESATPRLIAFFVRYTSGFLRVALPEAACDRLNLPPMPYSTSRSPMSSHCVAVDAAHGVGTGISATDRAFTIRRLVDHEAGVDDFHRPGHVIPVRARDNGVVEEPGLAEAVVDLMRLAGLRPGGVFAELVTPARAGDLACGSELTEFAAEHGLVMVPIEDVLEDVLAARLEPGRG